MTGLRNWIVSIAATVASNYALDAFAAAAGVALVASGLIAGLGVPWLLLILAVSYVAWAVGLRAALHANWTLLLRTGTSTNVLSKGAYDLARRTSRSARVARLAAAAGYAGTQVAGEAIYYAGAFGAAAFSDSVTSTEALGFLAGANLAAALYEYGLARITTGLLRRWRRYASFDTDWEPAEYLAGYYRSVEPDEVATVAFLVGAMRQAESGRPVLFFGVGPTLHHVFAAAETASEIHLGDYLPANLAEIRRWIRREPGAHDWRPFVRYTLQCEGISGPTDEQIAAREDLTRSKITKLVQVDARHPRPVDRHYPMVISPYCADSATSDRTTWLMFMRHITGLVEPGGLFITAALRRCRGYTVAGKTFPGADVDEHDLRAALRPEFEPGAIEVRETSQDAAHGYSAVLLCQARRRPPLPSRVAQPVQLVEVHRLHAPVVADQEHELVGAVALDEPLRPAGEPLVRPLQIGGPLGPQGDDHPPPVGRIAVGRDISGLLEPAQHAGHGPGGEVGPLGDLPRGGGPGVGQEVQALQVADGQAQPVRDGVPEHHGQPRHLPSGAHEVGDRGRGGRLVGHAAIMPPAR
ncbi:NNMT/PNMT/TEMT family protein [Paractinoplanes atraurantiacus]|uniref:NNMT/PNMT/TEMT family protein n=1 Tax=Paractinoplanes atraurantiacus TaxID=1036182 RepID=A0A285HVA4_9ACTN|nr:NNMT/PNMT/TEMT family protein [Actinoplanes atraurantiacus]